MIYDFNNVCLIRLIRSIKLMEQKQLWLNQIRNTVVSGQKNIHAVLFKQIAERLYWNATR